MGEDKIGGGKKQIGSGTRGSEPGQRRRREAPKLQLGASMPTTAERSRRDSGGVEELNRMTNTVSWSCSDENGGDVGGQQQTLKVANSDDGVEGPVVVLLESDRRVHQHLCFVEKRKEGERDGTWKPLEEEKRGIPKKEAKPKSFNLNPQPNPTQPVNPRPANLPTCLIIWVGINMACFHCECKQPKDEYIETQMHERQQPNGRTRIDNNSPTRKEVSDAWNFDFDENESDGAEVSVFEYVDTRKLDEDRQRPGIGFDDFDDEEEDDVNSYELDTNNHNQSPNNSSVNFSDINVDSDSGGSRNRNASFSSRKPLRRKPAFYDDDDGVDFNSDDDLPVHPNWKSSHNQNKRKMTSKFGSDEDSDLDSGDEDSSDHDFTHKHAREEMIMGKSSGKSVIPDRRKSKGFTFGRKGKSDRHIRSESFESGGGPLGFKSRNRSESYGDKQNRRSNRASGEGGGDSYLDHERFSRPRVNKHLFEYYNYYVSLQNYVYEDIEFVDLELAQYEIETKFNNEGCCSRLRYEETTGRGA
ncbi:hypothetical protein LXL04_038947 [Taraxacum kok-saghyz]